jgi:hypothetical protein
VVHEDAGQQADELTSAQHALEVVVCASASVDLRA